MTLGKGEANVCLIKPSGRQSRWTPPPQLSQAFTPLSQAQAPYTFPPEHENMLDWAPVSEAGGACQHQCWESRASGFCALLLGEEA